MKKLKKILIAIIIFAITLLIILLCLTRCHKEDEIENSGLEEWYEIDNDEQDVEVIQKEAVVEEEPTAQIDASADEAVEEPTVITAKAQYLHVGIYEGTNLTVRRISSRVGAQTGNINPETDPIYEGDVIEIIETSSKEGNNVPTFAIGGATTNGKNQFTIGSSDITVITGFDNNENASLLNNYDTVVEYNGTTTNSIKEDGVVISEETGSTVEETVAKQTPTVTAPTAKTLFYNGSAQELISAGSTTGGTLQYKLGTDGTYSTTIPSATALGAYTVYYKVVGNDNYNDIAEASVGVTNIVDLTYTLTGSKKTVLKASELLSSTTVTYTDPDGKSCTAYNGYIEYTDYAKLADANAFVAKLNTAQLAPSGKIYGTGAGQGKWRLLSSMYDGLAWNEATGDVSDFGGVDSFWSSEGYNEGDTYGQNYGLGGIYAYDSEYSRANYGILVIWAQN